MGQKVNPLGFRLGVVRTWDSRWFLSRGYKDALHQDFRIRSLITERLKSAGVSRIVIERPSKQAVVTLHVARPGVVVGKKGQDLDILRSDLKKMTGADVKINLVEIRRPELDPVLIADSLAQQLKKRSGSRRAVKKAIQSAMRFGAQGVRVCCSGRLDGVEIARQESYKEGKVPLHTLRAAIGYGRAVAKTTYGTCGVKVWVYEGEVLDRKPSFSEVDKVF